MKLSKIALTYCPCGFSGSLAFFASDGFKAQCPQCNKQTVPHERRSTVTDANRRFSGQGAVSFEQGFHPAEVDLARKAMPGVAHCIKDDGRVVYPDSRTEQKFRKAMNTARQITGAKQDAAGLREYQRR